MARRRCRTALTLLLALTILVSVALLDLDRRHALSSVALDTLRGLLARRRTTARPGAWEPSAHAVTLAIAAFPSPSVHERCRLSLADCERASHDQLRSSLRTEADWLWQLGRLTAHIRWPMIIATTPALAPAVRALRPTDLLVLEFASAVDLPPIAALGGKAWADEQAAFVTFNHGWSPWRGVFAVWGAKAWLVAEAARLNPWDSRLFFWLDAGALNDRHPVMLRQAMPDLALLATRADAILAGGRADQIIVSAVTHPSDPTPDESREDWELWIQALLFGGTALAVDGYASLYQSLLERQKARHASAAREEGLMTWLARYNPIHVLLSVDATGCRASPACVSADGAASFYNAHLYALLYYFSDPGCSIRAHSPPI